MKTVKIHIKGIVQGIGFRPFVYKLAIRHHLKGWVVNDSEGLRIAFEGKNSDIKSAINSLKKDYPDQAKIQSFELDECNFQDFPDFKIKKSFSSLQKTVLLTPDYSICSKCESDILNKSNRRYKYAFTTCTQCGPRYSIIEKVPYDRENTSMEAFLMCNECIEEYNNVFDRRYYSQTNSCKNCGVKLYYKSGQKSFDEEDEDLINLCINDLKRGKIVAVKGIGGFLLICDAGNPESIKKLRERKKRPGKPFALVYPRLEDLEDDVEINDPSKNEFNSPVAPIILFKLKKRQESGIRTELIAPGLSQIGVMKAYAPLILLLSKRFNKPLIASSANLSGSSIIFENKDALENLLKIADCILYHDRDILIPEDDSVIRFSSHFNKKVIIRRSRGLAPNYFGKIQGSKQNILATGASLKSSFSIYNTQNAFVSQYLGDLDSFESQSNYKRCLSHMTNVLDFKPDLILCDKHPLYPSSQIAEDLSKHYKAPLIRIQHHEAHFAAVLAENDLLKSEEAVLGVIWDGTGFGDDGNIWGGEFFTFENNQIQRLNHFDYYPHILGDKMPKEPRISALSILRKGPFKSNLGKYFNDTEWKLYNKILSKEAKIKTSSVGRIFDAVACILGLGAKSNYEGEAAMKLEQLASNTRIKDTDPIAGEWMNPEMLLNSVFCELSEGISIEDIAYNFHRKLIYTIKSMAGRYNINHLAFSGGVFQNTLLVDLILHSRLENEQIYFHRELSPNDENISFGQMAHQMISENDVKIKTRVLKEMEIKKTELCV